MKLFLIISLLCSMAFAKPIVIMVCKEKNYDCEHHRLDDVKKIEKINSGEYLRITFLYGGIQDIFVRNKYYEIKK